MLAEVHTLLVNGHRYMLIPVSVYSDDNLNSTTDYRTGDSWHFYLLEYGTWAE